MRLERLALKGFSTAFPAAVDLPLGDIPSGLVALVGGNGAGKTSLLEATAAAIYRKLPARNGMDPIDFTTVRDGYLDLTFSFDDGRRFRSRLNLDASTRKTDAVLEQLAPDGSRVPLNNGQRSTYDAAIKDRFPSFELFLNSVFAAQGRGDEFARTAGTKRKDLFAEFLNLRRLLTMAARAKDAADLATDARLRLTVKVEQLEQATAPGVRAALDAWANELQVKGGTAELRQRALAATIADLDVRQKLSADQDAAFTVAQQRAQACRTDLQTRQGELGLVRRRRTEAQVATDRECRDLATWRDDALKDLDAKLAGNQQIQEQAVSIRAAVAAVQRLDAELATAREAETAGQDRRDQVTKDLAAAERALTGFVGPEKDLTRAKTDSALLATVPCGGTGPYAACQFLLNATTAAGRIEALEAQVAGMTAAIATTDALKTADLDAQRALATHRETIARLTRERATHERAAKYETALAHAEARIAELTTQRATIVADTDRGLSEAQARHAARVREFEADETRLQALVDQFIRALQTAQEALDAATAHHRQAADLDQALTAARQEWDTVTRILAEVASGHAELARRRETIAAQLEQVSDYRQRLTRVENELLEWQFLAKALGKGGLPDLEIDAAGPEISATTNALLHASYGTRFSLELVTQIEKADGSGWKDEFTVRVLDSEASDNGWRDISELSGGEKVVVQEAFMCALALYVNERSPLPMRTLFRDETGAALDAENAVRYVQMLRKVCELGRFVHVFFISHNAAAYALADTQIQVGGGQARIVHQPFEEAA